MEPRGARRKEAVIWLPGLTGKKEGVIHMLETMADNGFVAISFDPCGHGERRRESEEAFRNKIDRNKRRYFWPMMTITADEYPRVMDWAIDVLGVSGRFMAGGYSMGGDIALVAAGLDRRIEAVAACVSTPDWLRPGSDERPSDPDTYAVNCFNRSNPLTNPDRYSHSPAISFQNGAADGHVPPGGARRFRSLLEGAYAHCPDRFEIAEYETDHRVVPEMREGSLRWFLRHSSPSASGNP